MTEESPLELVRDVRKNPRWAKEAKIIPKFLWADKCFSHYLHHQQASGLELQTVGTKNNTCPNII